MNQCESYRRWIDDAVDGDLRIDFSEDLEAHLDKCGDCRRRRDELRALVKEAADLPKEMDPARDLWPGIEDRLSGGRPPRWAGRRVVVAAAAVVFAAVGLTVWRMPATGPMPTVEAERGVVAADYREATIESVRLEYRQARDELLVVVQARRNEVPPETLEIIDNNLALIDQAINEIEKVLAANPGEGRLDRHLRMAYARQIDLLRWATRIPSKT